MSKSQHKLSKAINIWNFSLQLLGKNENYYGRSMLKSLQSLRWACALPSSIKSISTAARQSKFCINFSIKSIRNFWWSVSEPPEPRKAFETVALVNKSRSSGRLLQILWNTMLLKLPLPVFDRCCQHWISCFFYTLKSFQIIIIQNLKFSPAGGYGIERNYIAELYEFE